MFDIPHQYGGRRRKNPTSRSMHSRHRHSVVQSGQDDIPPHIQRPKLTPRTKRKSISPLNELVRRQKEKTETLKAIKIDEVAPHPFESLFDKPVSDKRETQLIQVAVRCRAGQWKRPCSTPWSSTQESNDSEDNESDAGHDSGVIQFNTGSESTGMPSISVPCNSITNSRRHFEFEYVLPPSVSQQEVYQSCVEQLVTDVLSTAKRTRTGGSGVVDSHATIVAYGQTGTGKTYTMGMLEGVNWFRHEESPRQTQQSHIHRGIIPRALEQILTQLAEFNESRASKDEGVRLVASMSFIQIYLENVQDLLFTNSSTSSNQRRNSVGTVHGSGNGLQVRLKPSNSTFYVQGLSEYEIEHLEDAYALLQLAAKNRILASTARNKTSSRSHTLLTVTVRRVQMNGNINLDDDEMTQNNFEDNDEDKTTISFVDLAGSERVEGTLHFLHATRKRQELRIREAKFINRSLSALGNVIGALASQQRKTHTLISLTPRTTRHIRFRDSQLTKLLQSRLMNGHGRLLFIATIDDQAINLSETLSTLKFADQCRRVAVNASQSQIAQKKREESLLRQAYVDVKAMYEDREAKIQRKFQADIAVLEQKIRDLSTAEPPTKILPDSASYDALCSLVDHVRWEKQRLRNKVQRLQKHPTFDSFDNKHTMISYVEMLHNELKLALMATGHTYATDSAAPSPNKTFSPSQTLPENIAKPKISEFKNLTRTGKVHQQNFVLSPDHEKEFQAIARQLVVTHVLDTIVVSSDEEESIYSQL